MLTLPKNIYFSNTFKQILFSDAHLSGQNEPLREILKEFWFAVYTEKSLAQSTPKVFCPLIPPHVATSQHCKVYLSSGRSK